ncbi:MAG: acylphosphatase [Candidatus Lernaella stagnicola]|nr:acylphosphatase [Candidatus Lernaella stagnicola]
MIAKRIVVFGRVQGVWYRAKTKERADKLSVTGWVRNNADGSVEAVLEGEEDALFELVNWMGVGPRLARVDRLREDDIEPAGYDTFEIVRF